MPALCKSKRTEQSRAPRQRHDIVARIYIHEMLMPAGCTARFVYAVTKLCNICVTLSPD
jgi:hypothetical protein